MVQNSSLLRDITVFSILVFVVFIILGNMLGVGSYALDSIVLILITLFLYFSRKIISLNPFIFILLEASMMLHNAGIFGFYYISPIPIRWDIVTHFSAIMASSMAFFCILKEKMGSRLASGKAFFLVVIAVLAGLGIGSLIETAEFVGFSILGYGEGGFMFGFGDLTIHHTDLSIEDQVESFGGGWFNTMHDLISNLAGALVGVSVMSFVHFRKKAKGKTKK